jgi:CheY-like chemotaxis protein
VPAVVIAASNLISPLCDQLASEGELITFSDSEPIQALQAILERRPELIVLERLFAATPRGAALINRIKTDPELAHAEITVMSHTGDYTRQITRTGAPGGAGAAEKKTAGAAPSVEVLPAAAAEVTRAIDWHGTRRAPRVRVKKGVEVQLDGNAVTVVDLSAVGAQVLSATILRPNQKVRVTLPKSGSSVRCRGAIAWAKFELPKPSASPVYRAGVEFLDADAAVVNEFIKANKE